MSDPLATYSAAPQASPFSLQCVMLPVSSVTAEGLWVPSQYCKVASVEAYGTSTSFSLSMLGTDQLGAPLNIITGTVAGSIAGGDVITATVANQNIPGGSATVSYTALSSDTTTTVAAALAALMAANAKAQGIGLLATSSAAVITMSFPSEFPGSGAGGQYPSNLANVCSFSYTSSGSETVTFAGSTATGSAIGAPITSVGVTAVSAIPRWIRARLTALGNGNLGVNFAGVG